MHPIVRVSVDGRPVAGAFYERLISLSVTDNEGTTADGFDCELADGPPDFLEIPRKGASFVPELGYVETGSRSLGRFTVDQVRLPCLPWRMQLSGKSADMRSGKLKENRERHWDDTTLGAVVAQIAGEHGLTPAISPELAGHPYAWLGQQDESDLHLVERLARRHNALFAIKDGILVFAARGSGLTASGAAMGSVIVTPDMVLKGTLVADYTDRTKYRSVVAYWQDRATAKRVEVEVAADADGDSVYRIPEPYADAAEADAAATSKAKALKRGEGGVQVTVVGDTGIVAGAPLLFAGIRPGVDGVPYVIATATHTYSKSEGYRTQITGRLYDGSSGEGDGGGSGGGASGSPANAPKGTPAAPSTWTGQRTRQSPFNGGLPGRV